MMAATLHAILLLFTRFHYRRTYPWSAKPLRLAFECLLVALAWPLRLWTSVATQRTFALAPGHSDAFGSHSVWGTTRLALIRLLT